MSFNLSISSLEIVAKGLAIFFLFFLFISGMHLTNIIKSKNSICDVEKQSKFILECLNAKELQSAIACERIAISLYCK